MPARCGANLQMIGIWLETIALELPEVRGFRSTNTKGFGREASHAP